MSYNCFGLHSAHSGNKSISKPFPLEILGMERRWLLLRAICALIWATELFWIQRLAFPDTPWVRFPVLVQCFRFYLDAVVAGILMLLLRRRYLLSLLVLNLVALTIIGTYQVHFYRPLMPVRAFWQWQEGWSLHWALWQILDWRIMLGVTLAVICQLSLLIKSGNHVLPVAQRKWFVATAAMAYIVPVLGLQATHLRLSIDPNGGMGRAVFAYGYTLPWLCDVAANRSMEHHAARAREFLSHEYDRITPLEEPLPVEARIVVLQLESFGGKAMDATHQGQWVMPFMRDLKEHSMFFRLKAFHKNGSCDMDFAATTFTEPYPGLVPYRVPGIKYTNAMPAFLKRFGFQTYFYHGNTSLFYDRGLVLDSLGFDHLVFREQLAPMRLPASTIGIRDAALLGTMLKSIQSENRGYFFAITLDTHSPYLQLSPDEMELFPAPSNEAERYLNALRYLDKCLKEFVAQLPPGTTLLMYGDHTTSLVSEEFTSDVVDGKEYVACYICKKGSDLAQIQRTRQQSIATDGSFNVLDVMSYLRHSIEARNATPQTRVIADRARS